VAEGTADNVFVVRGRRLLTPPPDAGILEGITRGAVMELAEAAGIDCREATLTRHDLYTADECFLTGTAAEVLPVVEIDGRKVGPGTPGPMTTRLIADFHRLVRG
jgi:branched-chain amino acid aminotransferase